MTRIFLLYLVILWWSCNTPNPPGAPNILWIVAEDLGPYIPSFGDSTIATPNLSRLASEGVCYDQVYSPSPVCAPSRAALATGMYPTHIGANHMRTGPWYSSTVSQEIVNRYAKFMPEGIQAYEPILTPGARMMSEYLRVNNYYCTNNAKEDYQFRKSPFAWDESSSKAHWRNNTSDKPFFSIFNLGITHESQIWARSKDSLWVENDLRPAGFPYLPSTDTSIMDIRRMYSNIKIMDQQVGDLIAQLEDDGLLEKTIIFWYTDHGGPLPRQKRLLYDSGIKVPMIIRFPNAENAGSRDDRLISFIDFAPTVLSLAGIQPPEHMDGKAFLGKHQRKDEPQYIFAAADRFDESYDANRAVRDKRYKYIRYYEPEKPMFLHVSYRDQMPIMQELYKLRDAGTLNPDQELWFRPTKPKYEFFDTQIDPHEIKNLAHDPTRQEIIERLSDALDEWETTVEDLNRMPEKKLILRFWPEGKQPVTSSPDITISQSKVEAHTTTPGASIGYQSIQDTTEAWSLFLPSTTLPANSAYRFIAHRIGYLPSTIILYEPE